MRININTHNLVVYTNALEKLGKSGLPVAVRGTLNDAAFAMKKEAIPKVTRNTFEQRSPNFFKANSRVEVAQGFNIKTMASTVGFVSTGLHNAATNYAVKDLEQQEESGIIKGRSFKPLPGARKGGTGNVRPNNRISQILKAKNLIDIKDVSGANEKQKLIHAAHKAGVGGYVLGGKILFRVKALSHGSFIKEKLFSFKKDGVAKVNATHFMHKAAMEVEKEVPVFFRKQFIKQWERVHKGKYTGFL